jgi:Transmembrane proteins 14C
MAGASLGLAALMTRRYLQTGKLMPAGVVAAFSAGASVMYGVALASPMPA